MSERYRVRYTQLAKDDLKNIYRYIANQLKEPQVAAKLTKRIKNSIKKLDFSPERFVRVDFEPWNSMNMRHFPVGNYEIYYIVDNEKKSVTIIRIFYGGRDIETLLNDID